jgi:transcriptional regulator with XRE-family HTH domain
VRGQARLTQAEPAERLSSKQPAIARLEAGETSVNMRTLERIAEVLDLEIERAMGPRNEAFIAGVPCRTRRT